MLQLELTNKSILFPNLKNISMLKNPLKLMKSLSNRYKNIAQQFT